MQDKKIICKDCGQEFLFMKGEQIFYAERGFEDPIRCPQCRKARKDSRKNLNNSTVQEADA